jgi:hypothetical protein
MKSKSLVVIALISLATSCMGPNNDYTLKVKLLKLEESDMYDPDMVYDVIFDAEENNIDSLKEKSHQLFLEGINVFKNEKRASAAVDYFKESILTFPDAKTYYELGSALMESNNLSALQEGLKSLKVAERLNFQPLSNIYYKQSCINNIIAEDFSFTKEDKEDYIDKSIYLMRKAFENGFTDTLSLKENKRMSSLLSSKEYKKMMVDVLAHQQKNDSNSFFHSFKESFPIATDHLEIPLSQVDMKEYKESISYDYAQFIPEMENVSFGRDVSHDFFYVAKIEESANYTALVYSSVNFYGEEMQPVYTTLATYDNDGQIISKKLISCQCSAEKIKQGSIEKNIITIRDYKRIWEKPIDKIAFSQNVVKDYSLIAEAKFKIDDSGKILNEEVPANYSDSSLFVKK